VYDYQCDTTLQHAHKMLGIMERVQFKLVNHLVAAAQAHLDLQPGRTLYQYLLSVQDHQKVAEKAWNDGTERA
jgi:hypothetical protein